MSKRVIIAGGGTGGHIFPAIAIAKALQKANKEIEILFVGARGRMEMEKIPQAGYKIEGLDIAGFNRSSLIKNAGLPFKMLKSFFQVRKIFKNFQPHAVVGVGGYSSFPVLKFAQLQGIPSFIHESNSFAGKSNMMVGRKATKVFTGTAGMEKFFPPDKIIFTGNPVRTEIVNSRLSRKEGIEHFNLDETKQILLVVGGSLGAKSINLAIDKGLDDLIAAGLQVIWQTGKPYAAEGKERGKNKKMVWVNDFITDMQHAYAAADIVIARAGAMTVAELCVVKKPVLFVPYPFAAEDHQTVNARQLVDQHAAMMVKDSDTAEKLVPMIIELAKDKARQEEMKKSISELGVTNADDTIALEILKVIK
jgi:UDP-N-acetylglucosamine--N-acetylmuramyl-(pentapeptide) pyrophosphoryl-undecaprenol N-acetylglucosamine transferase